MGLFQKRAPFRMRGASEKTISNAPATATRGQKREPNSADSLAILMAYTCTAGYVAK